MRAIILGIFITMFFGVNSLKSSQIGIHVHTHTHNQSALHSHEHIHSDTSSTLYLNTKQNHQKKFEYKISFYESNLYIPSPMDDGIFRPPIV